MKPESNQLVAEEIYQRLPPAFKVLMAFVHQRQKNAETKTPPAHRTLATKNNAVQITLARFNNEEAPMVQQTVKGGENP